MQQRDPRAYLWDVQEAALAIQTFVDGLDAEDYLSIPIVQAAVERKFEVIGEAVNRLAKLDPVLAARIPHHRQIIAFRNLLIHGYAAVSHRTIWDTVNQSLPALLACVRSLLQEPAQD